MRWPLWIVVLLYLAASYFLSSIPFGVVVVRGKDDIDIRKVGSGNIGTTNVARASGAPAAGLTLLLDAGKGFLCTFLARILIPALVWAGDRSLMNFGASYDWILAAVFLVCIMGHVFSVYLKFHGGKGIAVGFGAALGLFWPLAFGLLAVFLLFVIPTRYVSLGSCMAALSLPVWGFVLVRPSWLFLLLLLCASILVVWAHRENIQRLFQGTERRFSFNSESTTAQKTENS